MSGPDPSSVPVSIGSGSPRNVGQNGRGASLSLDPEQIVDILDSVSEGVLSTDQSSTIVMANAAAKQMFGVQELVGTSLERLIPERFREQHRREMRELAGGAIGSDHDPRRPPVSGLRSDGTEFPVEARISVARAGDERLYTAIVRDLTQQHRAERERHASRAQFEAALASMSDAVFISDTEGNFIDFNEAFSTFHRFASREQTLRTLQEYPDVIEVYMADGTPAPLDMWAVPRALRGEVGTNVEYGLRRKDTGEGWVGSYSFAPIRDQSGVIIGSVVTGRDVTAIKREHEALQRMLESQDRRLASIVESSSDAIMSIGLDLAIKSWNAAAERMFGYTAEEAIGRPVQMLAPDQVGGEEQANVTARVRAGEKLPPFETIRRRKDGTLVDVSLVVSPLYGAADAVVGFSTIVRDITERKRAAQELARSRERLEQAELIAHMGSWEWDLRTGRSAWSAGLRRIFKLEAPAAEEGLERALADRVHPDDRERLRTALERAVDGLTGVELQYRAIRSDGRVRILDASFDPIVDDTGTTARVIGVLRDVTETKQAQETLSRASSNLVKFAADLQQLALETGGGAELSRPSALSARQLEILRLVARGHTNNEIAKRIYLSEGTVKWHIKQILLKTKTTNRTEAVVRVLGSDAEPAGAL